VRHFSDHELKDLISVPEAVTALEAAFAAYARGEASAQPRMTIGSGLELSTMSAILPSSGYCAAKVYTRTESRFSFVVLLFSAEDGRILATFDAGELTKLRTAAVSGLAARYLARKDARRLAIFGTGRQAGAHLSVLPQMFAFESIQVVSRGDARAFCERMSTETGVRVTQASAEEALAQAGMIVTATRAVEPLFDAERLEEGTFIAAVGSAVPHAAEVGSDTILRCDRIAVEALDHAHHEAGDLIQAADAGALEWESVVTLGDLIIGRKPGRASEREITLFKSVGSALEDVAVAALAYEKLTKDRDRGSGS
jgi:ornithine cyclodeaminase